MEMSGLMTLLHCSYKYTDKLVVSAMLKRRQLATYSFHMPFGEMSITLDDVSCLIGLSVTGLPVTSRGNPSEKSHVLVSRALGIADDDILGLDRNALKLDWLRIKSSKVTYDN